MRLKKKVLDNLIDHVDIIEGWNSRGLGKAPDLKAQAYALKHGKVFAAGSDAHTRFEIGNAYVEMKPFRNKKEFLKNLSLGALVGKKTNLVFPAGSSVVGRAKVLTGHRGERARQLRLKESNNE